MQTYSVSFATHAAASGELTIVLAHDGTADPANIQVLYDNVRIASKPIDATETGLGAESKAGKSKPEPPARQPAVGRTPEK